MEWNFQVINMIGNNNLNEWFQNNLLRYRSSSAYNQLLIAHIMSKMIFMKYLPPGTLKMVPKLKMLRIYQNLAHLISQVRRSLFFFSKMIFIKYLPPIILLTDRPEIILSTARAYNKKVSFLRFRLNFNKFWAFLILELV